MKCDIWVFVENPSRKLGFHWSLRKIPGSLPEVLCTSMKISGLILLTMRNVSDRIVGKIKTHILCSVDFFSENLAVCQLMWKNTVGSDRPQMTVWYDACAWRAACLRLQTRRIFNTHCFTTTKVVTRKHLSVTFVLCVHWCLVHSYTDDIRSIDHFFHSSLMSSVCTKFVLGTRCLFSKGTFNHQNSSTDLN